MQKELNTSQTPHSSTPSTTEDHPPPFHDHASLTDNLEAEGGDKLEDRSPRRRVGIPVVLPILRAEVLRDIVIANFSLNSSPITYRELTEEIVRVSRGPIWNACKGDGRVLSEVKQGLRDCMQAPGCVYFVWDFAPPIDFLGSTPKMPEYGVSDAFYLCSEEIRDHVHAAYVGKITHIFILAGPI